MRHEELGQTRRVWIFVTILVACLSLVLGIRCLQLTEEVAELRTRVEVEHTICDGRVAIWREDSDWWSRFALEGR